MAGGMEVHKNKFVEQWATNRENLEMVFRFNRRTIPICLTFGLALPLLTYYGIVAEFKSFILPEKGQQRPDCSMHDSGRESSPRDCCPCTVWVKKSMAGVIEDAARDCQLKKTEDSETSGQVGRKIPQVFVIRQ